MSNAKCVLISVAASAFMLATATLNAANPPVQRSMAVQFSDLNLERPGDVAQLYQRISAAADRICSNRIGLYDTLNRYQGCVAEATQRAVGSVNRTALTDFYRQQQSTPDSLVKVARQ
jgi:UrcA family protein